jgi:hypothetical protein
LNYQQNSEPTFTIDPDWTLSLSHGVNCNYLITGEAIKLMVDHIKYVEMVIENCPGNKKEIDSLNILIKEKESEIRRLESELARAR